MIVQPEHSCVKRNRGGMSRRDFAGSLLAEGLAVGALVHGGVSLVGTNQDAVQRAVVFVLAVVCALMDGALDALVGVAFHRDSSFL